MVASRFDLPCNRWRRRSSDRNISLRSRLSSYGVFFTANSHGNCSSLLWLVRNIPAVRRDWFEPGSVLVILPLLLSSNWTSKYRTLHCIFYSCPNFVPVGGTFATALSCPPFSMDLDNCGPASTSLKRAGGGKFVVTNRPDS